MSNKYTSVQLDIVESLFFVISFQELCKELNANINLIESNLWALVEQDLVIQYQFNIQKQDFIELNPPNKLLLKESSFLASKQALLDFTIG